MSFEPFDYDDIEFSKESFTGIQRRVSVLERAIFDLSTESTVTDTRNANEAGITDHNTLSGLLSDDHLQYLLISGTRAMSGDLDMDDAFNIKNLNVLQFNLAPTNDTPAEGDMYYNPLDKTMNIKTDTDTILQVGQEVLIRGINKTGATLNNGEIVFISGADSDRPTLTLAQANTIENSQATIGIITSDILDDAEGFATTFGFVRDLDTSGFGAGDEIWLSDSTPGDFTNTKPSSPSFVVRVGYVTTVDGSAGTIFFNVEISENYGFFNGTINEHFDLTVDAAGGVVTASLERSGGGDLTMNFSTALITLDTSPAVTIVLTAGTDIAPQENYLYIPESTKVLTLSLSDFPSTEHIKVAFLLVESAATVQTNTGCRVNQNWNDAASGSNAQGHMSHMGERIRRNGVIWFSGVDGNGASDYMTLALNSSLFLSNVGDVYQMHKHTFPAFTQGVGSEILIVNDSVTPFLPSADLYDDIAADSTGGAIGLNKYFNLVFWGVGNKTGEPQFIMCNLPGGSYNTQAAAENDTSNFDDLSIPREFAIDSSTGFLIARITFQMGTTWSFVSTVDLRGTSPSSAGGAGSIHTRYTDAEAIAAVEAEPTLALTGALSAPSLNINSSTTITAILDEDNMVSDSAISLATQQSIKAYVDSSAAGAGWTPTNYASYIIVLDEDNLVSDRDDAIASQQSIKAYVDASSGGPFLPLAGGTLTGALTISSGGLGVTGDITGDGDIHSTGNEIKVSGSSPHFYLKETDETDKNWGFVGAGGSLLIQKVNDAETVGTTYYTLTEAGVGTFVGNQNFSAGIDVTGEITVIDDIKISGASFAGHASYKQLHFGYSGLMGRNVSGGDVYLLSNIYFQSDGTFRAKSTDECAYMRIFEDQFNWLISPSTTAGNVPSFTEYMTLTTSLLTLATDIQIPANKVINFAGGSAGRTILFDGNDFKVGGDWLPSADDTYDIGSSSSRWDDIWATNSTIQTSTRELKTEIADLVDPLFKVNSLRGINFKWDTALTDTKNTGVVAGVIADEVAPHIPEAVVYDDGKEVGVRYNAIIPYLIEAIKELTNRVETLEGRKI